MSDSIPYKFTPVRIFFWLLMLGILSLTAFVFNRGLSSHGRSDKPACILNQRNIQQMVRTYQNEHYFKSGDPIDWEKLFGPGGYMTKPVCPIHGKYTYSSVVPPFGSLAATCKDPNHQPQDIQDW